MVDWNLVSLKSVVDRFQTRVSRVDGSGGEIKLCEDNGYADKEANEETPNALGILFIPASFSDHRFFFYFLDIKGGC